MEQTRLQKRGQKAVFSWRSHQFERSLEIFISQGFLRMRPSGINFRLIFGVLQSTDRFNSRSLIQPNDLRHD